MGRSRRPTPEDSHLMLDNEAKMYPGEKTASTTNPAGKLDVHEQRMKSYVDLSPCTKSSSEWIKDLSLKPETLKLLEENTDRTLQE